MPRRPQKKATTWQRWKRRLAAWTRSLSAASTLTILALLVSAAVVLWLTGRPEGGELWDFHPKVLEWKDRLTIAGAVAAGAGGAIALVVSYRKQRDAEEGRFSGAFAAAAAQLGDQSPAVRIAGAYALAALADRNVQHRQQCIDALCAYLRLNYTPEADRRNLSSTTHSREIKGGSTSSDTITYRAGDREVRLTIIRIIRDHLQDTREPTTWCGSDFDFTGASFDGGDFHRAIFSAGEVSFERTTFAGGRIAFYEATFSGAAVSFYGATFSHRRVSFTGATFSGGTVSFNDATFAGGKVTFNAATFSGGIVSFDKATFLAGEVTFNGATFAGTRVTFHHAEVSGVSVHKSGSHTAISFDGSIF